MTMIILIAEIKAFNLLKDACVMSVNTQRENPYRDAGDHIIGLAEEIKTQRLNVAMEGSV